MSLPAWTSLFAWSHDISHVLHSHVLSLHVSRVVFPMGRITIFFDIHDDNLSRYTMAPGHTRSFALGSPIAATHRQLWCIKKKYLSAFTQSLACSIWVSAICFHHWTLWKYGAVCFSNWFIFSVSKSRFKYQKHAPKLQVDSGVVSWTIGDVDYFANFRVFGYSETIYLLYSWLYRWKTFKYDA